MRTKDKVQIGYIDGGQVDGPFCGDLFTIAHNRADRIDGLIRVSGHLLSRLRNELVTLFLDRTDSAWLLMVDTDHRFSLQAFDKLIAAGHDASAPIVSGLCFAAYPSGALYPTPVPAIYKSGQGVRYRAYNDYPHDRLVSIDAAGTGCLLMHRSALEKVRDMRPEGLSPKWCFFVDGPVGEDWYSEDLSFMRRLADAGIPIHAHTGAVMPHIKTYTLTDAHHAQHMKELTNERAG